MDSRQRDDCQPRLASAACRLIRAIQGWMAYESTQRAMMTFIMSEVPADGPRTAASRQ
jgi:hypothetical protein